jgi:hypothetical protein
MAFVANAAPFNPFNPIEVRPPAPPFRAHATAGNLNEGAIPRGE